MPLTSGKQKFLGKGFAVDMPSSLAPSDYEGHLAYGTDGQLWFSNGLSWRSVRTRAQEASADMVLVYDTSLSAGTTIGLPLRGSGGVTVDWGDGIVEAFTDMNYKPHEYSRDGRYIVRISGRLTAFGHLSSPYRGGASEAQKLVACESFGLGLGLTTLQGAFSGASNLREVPKEILPKTVKNLVHMFWGATAFNQEIRWDMSEVENVRGMFRDAAQFDQPLFFWDVSAVVNMSNMFRGAVAFNRPLKGWDVSAVEYMSNMFDGALAFDQNLGSWDVSSVVSMEGMFTTALSTPNYNALLTGWSSLPLRAFVVFDAGQSEYSIGNPTDKRQSIIDNHAWVIRDAGVAAAMVLRVNTELAGVTEPDQILIPTSGTGYDCEINGESYKNADIQKIGGVSGFLVQLDAPGIHEIQIRGSLPRIFFNNAGDRLKVLEVVAFGDTSASSFSQAFFGCSNLTQLPPIGPRAPNVASFASCFNTTQITEIPDDLFATTPSVTTVASCFRDTPITSIPGSLFNNTPGITNAFSCFQGTQITAIPSELFLHTPDITDFSSCFMDTPVISIPAGLFASTPEARYFDGCFRGAQIVSIPGSLFYNTPKATGFLSCFRSTPITAIPENLFSKTPSATRVASCFRGTEITAIPGSIFAGTPNLDLLVSCFADTQITAIPNTLFSNTPKVANFFQCFLNTPIISIPSDLFDASLIADSFNYTFAGTQIASIPDELFANTPSVTVFDRCFLNTPITSVPAGLFDNTPSVRTFGECFRGTQITAIPSGLFDSTPNVRSFTRSFPTLTMSSYSALLESFAQFNTQDDVYLGAAESRYNSSGALARIQLIDRGWIITDGGFLDAEETPT